MRIKSIQGLSQSIKRTEFYKSKRPTAKPVLIDRCNFVINSIWQGNMHYKDIADFESVPLHSAILRANLGHDSEKIIKLLKDLNYIEVDHKYISQYSADKQNTALIGSGLLPKAKAESKKYSYTLKAKSKGNINSKIVTPKIEKRILAYKTNLIKSYLKDSQIHRKIFFNLSELHFDLDKGKKALKKFLDTNPSESKIKHYKQSFQTLKRLNDCKTLDDYLKVESFYYMQSKVVGRVFNYYSSIPKIFRKCLIHESGESLTEIDLRNSQPFIIVMHYLMKKESEQHQNRPFKGFKGKERKGNRGICCAESRGTKKDETLLNTVLNGSFYAENRVFFYEKGEKELADLFYSDYKEFKKIVLAKGLFYTLLPLKNIKLPEQFLRLNYPDFWTYIRDEKRRNGFKTISIQAQKKESDIFIRDLFLCLDHGKHFAVPNHDSILVKKSEADKFVNLLMRLLKNKFPSLTDSQCKWLLKVKPY